MKRRVIVLGGVLCILGVAFLAWLRSGSIYPKLLLGWARVLTKQIPVTVEIGDRRLESARCFVEPGEFQNHRSQGLVLWVEDPADVLGRHILVMDQGHGEVLVPNSGQNHYRLLRNRWLIQSDSGAQGIPFGNAKLDATDPNFQQSGNSISFTIPAVLDLPAGRWNVRPDPNGSV
jgi:hypothetical protein